MFDKIMRVLEWVTKSRWIFMLLLGGLVTSVGFNVKLAQPKTEKAPTQKVITRIVERCNCKLETIKQDIINLKAWHGMK